MKTLSLGIVLIAHSSVALAQEAGFKPLFDGKSLSGWEGNQSVFRVEDGAHCRRLAHGKIAHNEFLASKDEFGDFELRLRLAWLAKARTPACNFAASEFPITSR